MDNIIDRLKKMKEKKGKESSPLDDFFKTEEENVTDKDANATSVESDLDIKPIGKPASEEAQIQSSPPQQDTSLEDAKTEEELAKGIRELSFDDLDEKPEDESEEISQKKAVIEIDASDPEKVKRISLIVALLDAEQLEAAHQEIDKMLD